MHGGFFFFFSFKSLALHGITSPVEGTLGQSKCNPGFARAVSISIGSLAWYSKHISSKSTYMYKKNKEVVFNSRSQKVTGQAVVGKKCVNPSVFMLKKGLH